MTILLQAPAGAGNYSTLIMMVLMFVIMYFFFIRPQAKKQKEQKKFVDELKSGDNIVTMSGIHGKILSVEGDILHLDVDKGVKLKIEKSAVSMEVSKKYQSKGA